MIKIGRRNFLLSSGIGLGGLMVASGDVVGSTSKSPFNSTVLFQGDSITDAGRDRSRYYANDSAGMGRGYVFQIVAQLQGQNPANSWKFYNRGISGNKVFQLNERWNDDCLQLKPDILSLLIGVNDFWHTLSNNYKGTAETFENDLAKLLDRTLNIIPELKIIMGEPFAVKGGTAIDDKWDGEFRKYQKAAQSIAGKFKTSFIPYQDIFNAALKEAPAAFWCPDGVHPSMAGDYLMKEAWIKEWSKL